MNPRTNYEWLEGLIRLSTLIAALVVIASAGRRRVPIRLVVLNAGAVVLVNLSALWSYLGVDYRFFRAAGHSALAGLNPYAPLEFSRGPTLNPPTALPLFALFTRMPFAVWTAINLLGMVGLVAYSARVLRAQSQRFDPPEVARPEWSSTLLLALTAAVLASDASLLGIYLGQLSVWTAWAILAALDAQARRRPGLAGFFLALASVKISVMLPFLGLFLRRSDLRTWLVLAVVGLALGCALGGPSSLPERLTSLLERIDQMGRPGQTNDYSYQGSQNETIIGFDHLLYRLGLRDRVVIRGIQAAAIVALGAWVLFRILGGRIARGSAVALVALYSLLFFYHRIYDSVLLAVVCVHAGGRATRDVGRSRVAFAVASSASLLVLFFNETVMMPIVKAAPGWGPSAWPIRAFLLPYATWMILLAIVAIELGERWAWKSRSETLA